MKNELLIVLNQQKKEQSAIFCARLNNIASVIRYENLTAAEVAELIDQESNKIQAQQRGDY